MKIVQTPASLGEAAAYIFRSLGFGNFKVMATKMEARDNFRLDVHREFQAPGSKFANEDSAIAWLNEIGSLLKADILACDLVKNLVAEKDDALAAMTARANALQEQVQGLMPYRFHYEMEFELQHGKARE